MTVPDLIEVRRSTPAWRASMLAAAQPPEAMFTASHRGVGTGADGLRERNT
jgi:hypothetical protein